MNVYKLKDLVMVCALAPLSIAVAADVFAGCQEKVETHVN